MKQSDRLKNSAKLYLYKINKYINQKFDNESKEVTSGFFVKIKNG